MYNERVQEVERYRNYKWYGIRYYNYPDGEDLLGKLSFILKWSTIIGIFGGILNTKSQTPRNFKGNTVKVLQVLLPCIGMGFTFTCVTFYATRLRKKDDEINYILGGAATGALMGGCCGTLPRAAAGAFVLGIAGFFQKYSKLHDDNIFVNFKPKQFSPYFKRTFATSPLPADQFPPTWTK